MGARGREPPRIKKADTFSGMKSRDEEDRVKYRLGEEQNRDRYTGSFGGSRKRYLDDNPNDRYAPKPAGGYSRWNEDNGGED